MRKSITAILLSLALPFAAIGQRDTLRGDYTDLHLGAKSYFIAETTTVLRDLQVDAGAEILFAEGASLLCRGGMNITGTAANRVKITSATAGVGQGIVVEGNSTSAIAISYTSFENLGMPLNFIFGWYRPEIAITHCQFIRNTGSAAVIQVITPGMEGINNGKTNFVISQNLFAENHAPIYFEDFASPNLNIRFTGNTLAGNQLTEYGRYTFSGNALFGRADAAPAANQLAISGNSFVNNVLWDANADTVVHAANMGVYGGADSVLARGNFWGAAVDRGVRAGIYDHALNYTSPKLIATPFLSVPPDTAPPHIYKVERLPVRESQRLSYRMRDGRWKMVIDSIGAAVTDRFSMQQGLQSLQLTASRGLNAEKISARLFFLADSLRIVDSLLSPRIDTNNRHRNEIVLEFNYHTDSMFRARPSYLVVNGLTGLEGEYVPETRIGYAAFLNSLNIEKLRYELRSKRKDTAEAPVPKPVYSSQTIPYKKRFELGMIGAYALYYGTLSNKALFKNDFNSFAGIQFRYNLKNHVSLSLSYLNLTLTGADSRSGDSVKMARGMSFTTPVTCLSFQVEYDFYDNRSYTSKNKIRPSIGFGVDYIKFNPKGDYLGEAFDLQPLGTGGQNLAGAINAPYALSSLGAPISAQVRYLLNKNWIYSLFATYHLAFTDYLDDVGPDPYPDPLLLSAANPSKADAAAYFSNPTRRAVGKAQLRSGLAGGSDSFFTFGFSLAYHF